MKLMLTSVSCLPPPMESTSEGEQAGKNFMAVAPLGKVDSIETILRRFSGAESGPVFAVPKVDRAEGKVRP